MAAGRKLLEFYSTIEPKCSPLQSEDCSGSEDANCFGFADGLMRLFDDLNVTHAACLARVVVLNCLR